ncbi:MAG: MFS transporter [Anaerolineae bacterium]|jgi:MFS family permease
MMQTGNKREWRPAGMRGFTIVWSGQVVSLLGSGMTWFALTIWAWELTGQATALALVAFFHFGPTILLSPIAGALVDRWDRKLVMMLSDLAAGLMTVLVLLLYTTGNLEIWHLYLTGAFAGAFEAFQFPAYSAAVTTMVPKEQYVRANGMLSLAESASGVFAPLAGGILLGIVGISGVLAIDVVTFIVAIGALLLVRVPTPQTTASGQESKGSLWQESLYGFRYIFERPSLLGLQLVFLASNLAASFSFAVLAPMILAQTGSDQVTLGGVQAVLGVGGVVGGLLLSVWGGPRRRVHGVLLGMTLSSLLGELVLGLGNGPLIWGIGAFFSSFFIPFINGSNQAIWQAKVAPDVQGRVFAARRLIAQLSWPIATLLAGPMADFLFEPALAVGGPLAGSFGGLVGTGAGAGMSLMFVVAGLMGVTIGLGGYAIPAIRNAEDILPDYDAAPEPLPAPAA